MKIKIFIDKTKETKIIESDNIKGIAKKLNLNLEEFIIVRNNELVSETVKLKDKDEIKFLSVISGG
ncbi:MoaD/ThiS family protein [Candidatus Woesearchaeota archaeon]|nr:MoaD/ThiS family protein [Candidatus Woesearchaeota archaeon]